MRAWPALTRAPKPGCDERYRAADERRLRSLEDDDEVDEVKCNANEVAETELLGLAVLPRLQHPFALLTASISTKNYALLHEVDSVRLPEAAQRIVRRNRATTRTVKSSPRVVRAVADEELGDGDSKILEYIVLGL